MKSITITPNKVRRLLESLGRITTQAAVRAGNLSQSDLAAIAELYPEFKVGVAVSLGTIRRFEGELYEVIQAHTTQADWTPPDVPALWKKSTPPGVIRRWVQPISGPTAYDIGDQVTHDNPNDGGTLWVYESSIDANTTEPGRDGTFDRYWTPVEVA